jgi:hypothetical protein
MDQDPKFSLKKGKAGSEMGTGRSEKQQNWKRQNELKNRGSSWKRY